LPLVPLGGLSTGLLLGYKRVRAPVVVGVAAGVVDIGLAALLVPYLDAMGAAIANVGAQLVAAVGALSYCVRLIGGVDLAKRNLGRLFGGSATAAGAAQLVLELGGGPVSFVLAVAVGVIVFIALAVWLRVLPGEDADWIIGSVAGRSGSRRIAAVCRRLSRPVGQTIEA
jgi:O-antigen/teichoic acid export membrane protein